MSEPANWPHLFEAGAGRLVIALHGTGATEEDAMDLAHSVAPGAAILAPRGAVDENGARRWFRRASEGIFDVDDVISRAADLAGFAEEATARYTLAGYPVTVVGFSNGANMALALGLLHPETARSVVAFSGMYPFGDRTPALDLPGTRILLLNGDNDPLAPAGSVNTLVQNAVLWGAAITRRTRTGGHGITAGEIESAVAWLAETHGP